MPDPAPPPRATGGCHCGAVTFSVHGPLRDVTVCHCSVCRHLHGGAAAFSACQRDDLVVADPDGQRTGYTFNEATYEHCGRCGGRLFWSRADRPTVSIAAGALDDPTGVVTTHHIYVASAADWEHVDDGLPGYPEATPVR